MTTSDLERGKQIQDDLNTLKLALSELNKAIFFKCDEHIRCYGSQADPFLSELNVHLKSIGVQKINKKISDLEKEFKTL